MDRLTIKITAGFLLIVDLLWVIVKLTVTNSYSLWGVLIAGFLGWVIWRNREPLPEPHLQMSLAHTNITKGKTIFSVCSSRDGYVHVAFDGTMNGNRAVIPCGVFRVLANRTDDFDITFPEGSTGKIAAALFPRYYSVDEEEPLFKVEAPLG